MSSDTYIPQYSYKILHLLIPEQGKTVTEVPNCVSKAFNYRQCKQINCIAVPAAINFSYYNLIDNVGNALVCELSAYIRTK